jgi:hypothetical protein
MGSHLARPGDHSRIVFLSERSHTVIPIERSERGIHLRPGRVRHTKPDSSSLRDSE